MIDNQNKIYLAEIHLVKTPYMEDSQRFSVTRIVLAKDEEEAKKKIDAAYTVDEPYSVHVHVSYVDLEEALV